MSKKNMHISVPMIVVATVVMTIIVTLVVVNVLSGDKKIERARAGVKVHVLLDWLGSAKMDGAGLASMEQAGVEIRRFHARR